MSGSGINKNFNFFTIDAYQVTDFVYTEIFEGNEIVYRQKNTTK